MRQGERGKVRDGQKGYIAEVLTNGGIFQSDTGARFTVLSCEFAADGEDTEDVLASVLAQQALFSHIRPGDGFAFKRTSRRGVISCKRIPGYLPHETLIPKRYPALESPTGARQRFYTVDTTI